MGDAMFRPVTTLLQAVRTISADRRWPLQVGLGGLWMLTLVGMVLPQGFGVEHLDNSRRGFRVPLPPWRQYGDKALMGLLALIIDFAFFFTPLLIGLMLLMCSLVFILLNIDASWVPTLILPLVGGAWLVSFVSSVTPVAKIYFAESGDLGAQLGFKALRRTLTRPARAVYLRARLISLFAYLPAGAVLVVLWGLVQQRDAHMALILGCAWLFTSALFWAWLVVGQVYLDAYDVVVERELDARIAQRQQI